MKEGIKSKTMRDRLDLSGPDFPRLGLSAGGSQSSYAENQNRPERMDAQE